jgi:hypothetical protein
MPKFWTDKDSILTCRGTIDDREDKNTPDRISLDPFKKDDDRIPDTMCRQGIHDDVS